MTLSPKLFGLLAIGALLGACAKGELILQGDRVSPRDALLGAQGATPPVTDAGVKPVPIALPGQTATAEARLVGPDGKLYAHGTTTCLVFELKAP